MRRRLRERSREETWQPRLYFKLLVLLLAIAYAVAFAIENHNDTRVHFVFHTTRVSLIWVILLCLALGMIGGVVVWQRHPPRRRHEAREETDSVVDLGDGDEAEGEPEGAAPTA
jgi:uncharacterized integral membrane protein